MGAMGKGCGLPWRRDQTASGCFCFSGTTPSFFCRLVVVPEKHKQPEAV